MFRDNLFNLNNFDLIFYLLKKKKKKKKKKAY